MTVVTISRERGSGGAEIARQVATSLGYDYADKDTIERVFRQYGMTKFDDLYSSTLGIRDVLSYDNLLTISMFNEMLEAIAQRGRVVIVGRGGFAVLGSYADVLDVRIEAPVSARLQRIMAEENLTSIDEATALVTEDDNMRRKFVKMFYNKAWDDRANFDLVLDTGDLSYDAAAKQIIDAVSALEQNKFAQDAVTTATIEVDPVLADAISKVMA